MARPGDLVITLGAGSIGGTGERILEAIRHRRTQPASRAVGERAMSVKAPAEKNFRRARARTSRRGAGGCARSSHGASRADCSSSCSSSAGGLSGGAACCYRSSLFRVNHVRVHGNVRVSSGEVQAIVARSPGHPHPHRRSRQVARRAARVTVARRGRAAPRAAVDDRRLRVRTRGRSGCAATGTSSTSCRATAP